MATHVSKMPDVSILCLDNRLRAAGLTGATSTAHSNSLVFRDRLVTLLPDLAVYPVGIAQRNDEALKSIVNHSSAGETVTIASGDNAALQRVQ